MPESEKCRNIRCAYLLIKRGQMPALCEDHSEPNSSSKSYQSISYAEMNTMKNLLFFFAVLSGFFVSADAFSQMNKFIDTYPTQEQLGKNVVVYPNPSTNISWMT